MHLVYLSHIQKISHMIKAEVCANSIESAMEGKKGGAFRIELCDNLNIGGTTPRYEDIESTTQCIDIQINTLIRPRGGDFIYSLSEFEIMKQDIDFCGQAGCNGVVFGILNYDGSIDEKRNNELLEIAREYGMSTTFHRAIDASANVFDSLENIINLGFDRILTSGGKETAIEGENIIEEMIAIAGNRIIIMPGGGITEENIANLVKATKLKEFHGSFRDINKNKTDQYKVEQAIKNANAKHL